MGNGQLLKNMGEQLRSKTEEVEHLKEVILGEQCINLENQRKLQIASDDKELMWTSRQEVAVMQARMENLENQLDRANMDTDNLSQEREQLLLRLKTTEEKLLS